MEHLSHAEKTTLEALHEKGTRWHTVQGLCARTGLTRAVQVSTLKHLYRRDFATPRNPSGDLWRTGWSLTTHGEYARDGHEQLPLAPPAEEPSVPMAGDRW